MFLNPIKSTIPILIVSGIIACLSAGCDWREPQWRAYEEVNTSKQPAHNHVHDDQAERPKTSSAKTALTWTKPEGWNEQAGTGMRLVTFTVAQGEQQATCTFVTLGGAAGGLEANVLRWLKQLNLESPGTDELAAFLERQIRVQTDGGFSGVVVDLAELGPAADGSSMLAALIDINGATLFVKMTGPADLLAAQKDRFTTLCQSLRQDS